LEDIEEVYYEEPDFPVEFKAWTTPSPMVSAKSMRRRLSTRTVV
jgi:hypothetical protein